MRTQITLDPEQTARVKKKAADLGITMAEYIRRLVDRDLATPDPAADRTAILGLGRSGGSDIARERKVLAIADAVERSTEKRR